MAFVLCSNASSRFLVRVNRRGLLVRSRLRRPPQQCGGAFRKADTVMPGLVPGIHVFRAAVKTWMAGTSLDKPRNPVPATSVN
jgi:hypothetical protein